VTAIVFFTILPGLLDPKWREQKERQLREKSEQENVYATGDNIELNLRGIAERRTDIFGVGVEEAEIGKKVYRARCQAKILL